MKNKELKTLKDLERLNADESYAYTFVLTEELKAEAVKWVIHGANKGKNMFKMFMDFFNLTEEELK